MPCPARVGEPARPAPLTQCHAKSGTGARSLATLLLVAGAGGPPVCSMARRPSAPAVRPGVMAARRPLVPCGPGSNPGGGATCEPPGPAEHRCRSPRGTGAPLVRVRILGAEPPVSHRGQRSTGAPRGEAPRRAALAVAATVDDVSLTPPAAVIVLAAGEGTRMRSATPKVLHRIGGRSLLGHVLVTARDLSPARIAVVVR